MICSPRRPRISCTSVPRAPLIPCTGRPPVFAKGLGVGADQDAQTAASGPEGTSCICPPEPPSTRDEAVRMWVDHLGSGAPARYGPAARGQYLPVRGGPVAVS